MEQRYAALRILSTVYKILGIISAGITLLVILALCATVVLGGSTFSRFSRQMGFPMASGVFGAAIGILFALLYGGGIAITFYAAGEGVNLLLDLEANTRETAALLRKDTGTSPPPPPPE